MAAITVPTALQLSRCFSLVSAPKPCSVIFLSSRLSHDRPSSSTSCKLRYANRELNGRPCGRAHSVRCDDYSITQLDRENELFEGGCFQHWEAKEVIQRKANRIEIPLSMRMRIIKKKKQWFDQGLREAATNGSCSVTKALSSLFSIVSLLHSSSLQRRTSILDCNTKEMWSQVETDLYFSFLWIFQKAFSKSPGMLVDLMLLLASFTVCFPLVATTGLQLLATPIGDKRIGEQNEELNLQNSIEETMNGRKQDEERTDQFVLVLRVNLEPGNYEEYLNTDLVYQMNLACEPNNSLLLSNYAQFLYLVSHSYDRSEVYFRRALEVDPEDAEALSWYANFLWVVRKDVLTAEEMYQRAIEAEPENPYYAARYVSFLWSSGGDETCFLHPSR